MTNTASLSNREAEAIIVALEAFMKKHGPEHALTDAMQQALRVLRDGRIATIHIAAE